MTMTEKILARAAGRDTVGAGDTVVCRVDMNVLIDLMFTKWPDPVKIADPDRTAIILDHAVPAPSLADANAGTTARAFAREFAIEKFFDVGRHGICHQVIAENALALPGQVLTCTDSHTCAGGAYNTAARGLGPAEVIAVLCTGQTWFTVGPTIRYQLEGTLPAGVGGKDVFLHLAGTYGDAANHNLEFGGPGLRSVPMNDRRTIATQGAEVSADFSIFEFDEQCGEFLAAHGAQDYRPAGPDPDAGYAEVRTTDLSVLEPYVARPGKVSGNALPISQIEHRAFAMKLPIPEAARHVFYDLRPGWTEQVRPGDIVVAGRNFGIGSSRPVAALMRELGVAALVAEEFNSLFLRNAINNGLPALTVPGVRELVSEGDVITVHLAEGWLAAGERRIEAAPLPAMVLDILGAGGLLPRLVADGYLAAGQTGAKG